jgi:hypothetical protein
MRLGKRRMQKSTPWSKLAQQFEKIKVSVRVKGEHPLWVVKRQFGSIKVR